MSYVKSMLIGTFMLAAAGAAVAMKPSVRMADLNGGVALEQLIPEAFGDWTIDASIIPIQVSPEVQAQLDKLYDQSIARTYVNKQGKRVMLSVAYGGTQSKALQVHRPEVCYVSQGFQLTELKKSTVSLGAEQLPVMNLVARLGQRNEPITYWIRFGESVVRGNVEQGLSRLWYGVTGRIPDGLLIRVSSISDEPSEAYELHEGFLLQLVESVPSEHRVHLIGKTHR